VAAEPVAARDAPPAIAGAPPAFSMRLIDAPANLRIQIAPFSEFETETGNLARQFRRRPKHGLIG
jgi:hypothetical protein